MTKTGPNNARHVIWARGEYFFCQNLIVRAAEYGQSAGVWSVGVWDVRTQGSKTRLKLMCFALAAGTGVSLYFGGSE